MKIIGTMNGWKEAPHCWKTHLTRPLVIDRTPAWVSVSVFGFVVFFETEGGAK